MASLKRQSDDDLLPVSKIQRIENLAPTSPLSRHPNNDFSGVVKKKLADSKRTGQACDRCKIRKIRCDGRPEGCTPCEQNRTACRTTDRITGRATVRGHAEAMESENAYLRRHIADLQAQLKELGAEPRAPPAYNSVAQTPSHSWSSNPNDSPSWSEPPKQTSLSPSRAYAPASGLVKSEAQMLPQFKHGSVGDNYLGVAAGDPLLSHIKGTSLSVFGNDVDITDFVMDGAEYESSPMSYTTLIKVALGNQPVPSPDLPPYKDLNEYAVWYLRSLNPYTMLVHKAAFTDLIWKFGNDPNFAPTSTEIVCVHMMLATIMYQMASRNSQSSELHALLQQSHAHYLYALSFYKSLMAEQQTWKHVQALAMICHHLRNFPKPGAAWMMTSQTYLLAIELGLHRSVKAWADETGPLTQLDVEMRKRVFWTLTAILVNMNGKLGRPMPISNEDIDVEFPEPMRDCLPGEETSLDRFHQCSFQVGIQINKYTVLELDMYKTIYAVKYSPRVYLENMRRLQTGIQQWKDEMPPELRDPSQALPDNQIFALYLEYWYQAYRLQLHHPAVCRSTDPIVLNSNLDACLDASQKMLHNCTEMMRKKSLDIPWINTVVFIAAIFTTLFISTMRKDDMSSTDMTKLKADMTTWIEIVGECDQFLGSENRLQGTISRIVDQSLGVINDSIVKRAASDSLAHVTMQTPRQSTPVVTMYDNGSYQEQYSTTVSGSTDPTLTSRTSSYSGMPESNTHSYNLGHTMALPQAPNSAFDQNTYSAGDEAGMAVGHVVGLTPAATSNASQAPNAGFSYSHHQVGTNAHQPPYANNAFPPQDWRQWTRTYAQLGQSGEYLNTATTLMTLNRDGGAQGGGSESQGLVNHSGIPGHVAPHWPEIIFPGTASHMGHH